MTVVPRTTPIDTAVLRKERGAFFTPPAITRFIATWAIRASEDRVLEPSAGDAAFLVSAVDRLRELGSGSRSGPMVRGVEIHPHSAELARMRIDAAGGEAEIMISDFFSVAPDPSFDAVIGNPPRYQDFSGEARARAREAFAVASP